MPLNLFKKKSSITFILLFLCLIFNIIGCNEDAAQELKIFFDKPMSKQHDEFLKLPIDKQYDIYIYSMTKRHPPDLSFADDIAEKGKAAVPFLTTKLKEERKESIQQKIIYLFERISRRNVNLKDDKSLIALIENTVASMNQPIYAERSEESLNFIKTVHN